METTPLIKPTTTTFLHEEEDGKDCCICYHSLSDPIPFEELPTPSTTSLRHLYRTCRSIRHKLLGFTTTTPCAHTFHSECLSEWQAQPLRSSDACPYCRKLLRLPRQLRPWPHSLSEAFCGPFRRVVLDPLSYMSNGLRYLWRPFFGTSRPGAFRLSFAYFSTVGIAQGTLLCFSENWLALLKDEALVLQEVGLGIGSLLTVATVFSLTAYGTWRFLFAARAVRELEEWQRRARESGFEGIDGIAGITGV